ncbi:hypothetical protein ACA910_018819 [Epithemia clementina (nom. ined.)]
MPFKVRPNPNAILDVFEHIGVTSSSNHNGDASVPNATLPNTMIDIGLPMDSLDFAQLGGFRVHGFEARKYAYNQVLRRVEQLKLQHLITIHHTALSNCSNQTMELFDADDSSSLLKTAILGDRAGAEREKYERRGRKKEIVSLQQLDDFVTNAVGIKIDTQGWEPEIFVGAPILLSEHPERGPFVVLTEYCFYMRPLSELQLGPRLLDGLGYSCYFLPHEREVNPRPATSLENLTDYCHDLLCIRSPAWNFTSTTTTNSTTTMTQTTTTQ